MLTLNQRRSTGCSDNSSIYGSPVFLQVTESVYHSLAVAPKIPPRQRNLWVTGTHGGLLAAC